MREKYLSFGFLNSEACPTVGAEVVYRRDVRRVGFGILGSLFYRFPAVRIQTLHERAPPFTDHDNPANSDKGAKMVDKQAIREIFPVRQKLINGDSIQEILSNIKQNRPDLAARVEAVKSLFFQLGTEGVLEDGSELVKSDAVYEYFKWEMKGKMQEEFWTVILDNKHKIVEKRLITRGTLNQSLVHPREVFAPAVELRAAAVILVHNHPSGDPSPSGQDIEITKRLVEAGNIIGINVLDHIVTGAEGYFSFIDEELI
jgi:DNA repair protein RadC